MGFFIKVFKAFIKPFEAPQRSVKIRIKLIFSRRPGLGQKQLMGSWAITHFFVESSVEII